MFDAQYLFCGHEQIRAMSSALSTVVILVQSIWRFWSESKTKLYNSVAIIVFQFFDNNCNSPEYPDADIINKFIQDQWKKKEKKTSVTLLCFVLFSLPDSTNFLVYFHKYFHFNLTLFQHQSQNTKTNSLFHSSWSPFHCTFTKQLLKSSYTSCYD